MNTNELNELKKQSKNGIAFMVMLNGKYLVINDIKDLPYCDTTLKAYLDSMDAFYKEQLQELQNKSDKQDKIINELINAIKELNK